MLGTHLLLLGASLPLMGWPSQFFVSVGPLPTPHSPDLEGGVTGARGCWEGGEPLGVLSCIGLCGRLSWAGILSLGEKREGRDSLTTSADTAFFFRRG